MHEFGDISTQTLKILNHLLFLTIKYGDEYAQEIESLWLRLCEDEYFLLLLLPLFLLLSLLYFFPFNLNYSFFFLRKRSDKNVPPLLRFLLDTGLAKRNPLLISHSKKIVVYIGRTSQGFNYFFFFFFFFWIKSNKILASKLVTEILIRNISPENCSYNQDVHFFLFFLSLSLHFWTQWFL